MKKDTCVVQELEELKEKVVRLEKLLEKEKRAGSILVL